VDEKTMSSIPGTSSGSSLHYTAWNRRSPHIYLKANRVLHSTSWEFPPDTEMTDAQIQGAKARGYVIMIVSESTITPSVETQPASGSKVQKRDPFIMLSEIEVDKLSEADLTRFVNLCDFYLEHYEEVLDPETQKLVEWFDAYDLPIDEAKMAYRTPLSKKLASAKRYHNRRQHILTKKKQAQAKKINKVIAKKMAYSKKTRTGREQKKYHVEMRSLDEYMKYVKLPPLPLKVSETRQEFEINGQWYSIGNEIIKIIDEALQQAIKNKSQVYITLEGVGEVEVRDLIKCWL
jgi:hypothetical protein